jgi:hypothetical protein
VEKKKLIFQNRRVQNQTKKNRIYIMVFTTDIRVGAIKVSMNTNWAEVYIHDCLRYERGEDWDESKLFELFTMIENELDNKLDRLVCDDGSFDTYDFFENVIGNNCDIMRLMEEVLVEVKDEEVETVEERQNRFDIQLAGAKCPY